jgi:hypothetical protein
MAYPVPADCDASSGTYRCTICGYRVFVTSMKYLPPCCSSCADGQWGRESGGAKFPLRELARRDPSP